MAICPAERDRRDAPHLIDAQFLVDAYTPNVTGSTKSIKHTKMDPACDALKIVEALLLYEHIKPIVSTLRCRY